MTCVHDNRFLLPAWGISLTLHGIAVVLAVLFAGQVRPIVQEEPFKWDVALVETENTESVSEATSEPAPVPAEKMVPRPVEAPRIVARRPVEPPPDTVMHRVAPQQTVQMVHPEAQPPKPIEQREEPIPPLKTEPATPPVKPAEEKKAEPIQQQVVESPKTQPDPVTPAKEPEPVQSAEPVIAQHQPVTSPPSAAVETRPIETPAKPSAPQPVVSSSPAEPAPPVSSPPASAASEAPLQTAKAAPGPAHQEVPKETAKDAPGPEAREAPVQTAKAAPGPETKTDHRWLAESLWRRVAELKRYPSSARLNGQEGKVVLKAVIRSDGHLIDVTVQKSSGHQILDAAAIEAVKLACPLHMKHAIHKPEIVVSLPIVYSLAN
ncbi:MAG TPA: TonB family protein [Nitrospira sp.]|jgi:protein TonB